MLNTFNLTTTAAALLAASNKNATTLDNTHDTQSNSQLNVSQPNIHSSKRASQTSIASFKSRQAEPYSRDKPSEKGQKTNVIATKTSSITESKPNLDKAGGEYQDEFEEVA